MTLGDTNAAALAEALRAAGRTGAPLTDAFDARERALRERIATFAPEAPADLSVDAPILRPALTDAAEAERFEQLLRDLGPWRKGPWQLGNVRLDAEWRAHWKWSRLQGELERACGGVVADVGCGNGYYLARWSAMHAPPRALVGFEPNPRFRSQWALVQQLARVPNITMSDGRLEALEAWPRAFDLILCAGVLYHVRDPVGALRSLRSALAPGGTLVLETIVVPGADPVAWCPPGRYLGARGFWSLPTVPCLEGWVRRAGFARCENTGVARTTPMEHGPSPWSEGPTLATGLSPDDSERTKEGLPAPARIVMTCSG